MVFLQSQGEGEERYRDVMANYGPAFDKLGFERRLLVRAAGVRGPEALAERPDVARAIDDAVDAILSPT